MPDIIKLLPDNVANQIAAGEVILRPASVIKELMENAVDAGSTNIQVIINDGGKNLIRIIDNGCGMSESDARMCFERYATSKLSKPDDLYALRTMGFRGEAMASVAAVAQVELKTRRAEDETGTCIIIEGSDFISQENCVTPAGTSISVKNIFFNVPARRNFLKSNTVETRHVIEEFLRVAIPRPHMSFSFHHNSMEVYNLPVTNLRQRLCSIFGANYNDRLVPVEEETSIINVSGFVGKPEYAKKVRGEQYFFINQRYIRDGYLHHAVSSAFDEMLPSGSYASYFLMLQMDPAKIDVNIHPTKTEIKLEDEKSVYAILRASVKRALGKFSIAPTLDFDQESSFSVPLSKMKETPVQPQVKVNANYNPFKVGIQNPAPSKEFANQQQWEKLYEVAKTEIPLQPEQAALMHDIVPTEAVMMQLFANYIVVNKNDELWLIDQQAAHERILFEKNLMLLQNAPTVSQQELFPVMMEFDTKQCMVLTELNDDLIKLGFDLQSFGKNTFVMNASPSWLEKGTEKKVIERLLDEFMTGEENKNHLERVAASLAKSSSVKSGTKLSQKEMKSIFDDLLNCHMPYYTSSGKPVIFKLTKDEIDRFFVKRV